jgi:K+-transporting ATPase ATPase C chain
MLKELKQSALFTLITMLLFGGGYHVVLWAAGRVAFPVQTEGSLIRAADGTVVGSRLIGQTFTRPEYFHPRPSAVEYDASSTGGTNLGPSNPEHLAALRERFDAMTARENAAPGQVPSEMVTASGSGLDPHISPAAAAVQSARVAAARGASVERIRDLVDRHTERPTFGFLGGARVNVLELNLALDQTLGDPRQAGGR